MKCSVFAPFDVAPGAPSSLGLEVRTQLHGPDHTNDLAIARNLRIGATAARKSGLRCTTR